MKAVWQARPEAIEKYARSDLRHLKKARLGQQTSFGQGEGVAHDRRPGRVQLVG